MLYDFRELHRLAPERMLSRLNNTARRKAGRLIALAYLLCVLAPGLSFAWADGSREAPCITEDHGLAMHVGMHHDGMDDDDMHPWVHMHDQPAAPHVDGAYAAHDHAHHGGTTDRATADRATIDNAAIPAKSPQKTSDTRCCGLVSLNAIPAVVVSLVVPPALTSLCEAEHYRSPAGNAPARLYRPPIS